MKLLLHQNLFARTVRTRNQPKADDGRNGAEHHGEERGRRREAHVRRRRRGARGHELRAHELQADELRAHGPTGPLAPGNE